MARETSWFWSLTANSPETEGRLKTINSVCKLKLLGVNIFWNLYIIYIQFIEQLFYTFKKSNQLKTKLFRFFRFLGTLVSNPCNPNPCKNSGTCAVTGSNYECTCPSGWTGTTCDVKTQSCQPNPCQNGGTCNIIGNSITCVCRPQFVGPNCESKWFRDTM